MSSSSTTSSTLPISLLSPGSSTFTNLRPILPHLSLEGHSSSSSSISSSEGISDEQATALWQRHVRAHRCGDIVQASNLALAIQCIAHMPVLAYRVESYVERRWIDWAVERIQPDELREIEDRNRAIKQESGFDEKKLSGLVARLISVAKPELFHDEKVGIRIPRSEVIKECSCCAGAGRKMCNLCDGNGIVKCPKCCFEGHDPLQDRVYDCSYCKNKAIVLCKDCEKDAGLISCFACYGTGKIRCFAMLNIEWKTVVDSAYVCTETPKAGSDVRCLWSDKLSDLEVPFPPQVKEKLEQNLLEKNQHLVLSEESERFEELDVRFSNAHFDLGINQTNSFALQNYLSKVSKRVLNRRFCLSGQDPKKPSTPSNCKKILFQKHSLSVVPIFSVMFNQDVCSKQADSMRNVSLAALGRPQLSFSASHLNRNLYPSDQYLESIRQRASGSSRTKRSNSNMNKSKKQDRDQGEIGECEQVMFWVIKKRTGEYEVICPRSIENQPSLRTQILPRSGSLSPPKRLASNAKHGEKKPMSSQTVTLGESNHDFVKARTPAYVLPKKSDLSRRNDREISNSRKSYTVTASSRSSEIVESQDCILS